METNSQNLDSLLTDQECLVLLIEDNPGDARLIEEYTSEIKSLPIRLHHVETLKQGLDYLAQNPVSLILLDLSLPDSQGLEMISVIQSQNSQVPILVLTGLNDEDLAILAVQKGAQDYLVKGNLESQLLGRSIRHSIERKKIVDQLRFQKTLLECEIEASLDGILIVFSDGQIHNYNERFLNYWELRDLNPYQMNELDLITKLEEKISKGKMLKQLIVSLDEKGKPNDRGEVTLKSGKILDLYVTTIQNQDQESFGRAWYFRDITQRKQMEQIKDEFISTVSHELRTPLAIIKGAVGNLKDGIVGELTEKQANVVATTSRNIDRLSRLINDLLDLSRLESGKTKAKRHKVNLASFINEVVKIFNEEAQNFKLSLKSQIPSELPTVFADTDMLMQLVTNLVQNAFRFAKSQISFEAHLLDDNPQMVCISVIDDGTGIEKDKIDSIFNKFEQLNRPSGGAGYKGTGLGLAICREIVDLHGGTIKAASEPGHWTRFDFTLPVYDHQEALRVRIQESLDQIGEQHRPLTIIQYHITNLNELIESLSETEKQKLFKDIEGQLLVHVLKRTDQYFSDNPGQYMLFLFDCEDDPTDKIFANIENAVKQALSKQNLSGTSIQFQSNSIQYPQDTQTVDQILQKII